MTIFYAVLLSSVLSKEIKSSIVQFKYLHISSIYLKEIEVVSPVNNTI